MTNTNYIQAVIEFDYKTATLGYRSKLSGGGIRVQEETRNLRAYLGELDQRAPASVHLYADAALILANDALQSVAEAIDLDRVTACLVTVTARDENGFMLWTWTHHITEPAAVMVDKYDARESIKDLWLETAP